MENFSIELEKMDNFDLGDSSFKIEKLVNELDDELKTGKGDDVESIDIEESLIELREKGDEYNMGEIDIMNENIKKIHEYLNSDREEEEILMKRLKVIEDSLDSIINAKNQ